MIAAKLIAIHGPSGSGKSVVAERLSSVHRFQHVSSGHLCRTITQSLFGHQRRAALNQVSQAVRSIDEALWIRATLRGVSTNRVVFDSVRYPGDADYLRAHGYEIWKIVCPREVCVSRLRARGQDFELSDLSHGSEIEIPDSICSNIIDSNLEKKELLMRIDQLVS